MNSTLEEARRLLHGNSVSQAAIDRIWTHLGNNYFLRADPDEIAWHTEAITRAGEDGLPLIALRRGHGGTELFVYTHDQDCLFAAIASTLDRLGLTVLDAPNHYH